tara:strand:+ start:1115 stop:1906 length:792 start_codon:yes stop_codon:yes gene_type:complete
MYIAMQKYFFLAGLSRAGNTLFSSIMNQNPDFAVTPNSILPDMLWRTFKLQKEMDFFTNFPDQESFDNVMLNIMPNYYSGWKEKYIMDRSSWGLPSNIEIIKKYIKNEIKIIVLVRDVVEVLASFLKLARDNKSFFLNQRGNTVEEKCDFIVKNQIHIQLNSIKNILTPENRELSMFIEYDDLVKTPKKIIDKVYGFLDIPKFNHRFAGLDQMEHNGIKYDDSVFGAKIHTIRVNSINKSDYKIGDLMSNDLIQKYSNMNIWR